MYILYGCLLFFAGRLFTTISTLALVPSLSLHKKRFTCDVHHETLTDNRYILRSSFDIEVTSPPNVSVIHSYPKAVHLRDRSHLTLSCQSHGGYPLGRISWYRLENGTDVPTLIDNSFLINEHQNATENNITMIVSPSENNVTFLCDVTNSYLYSLGQQLQTNITLQVVCMNFYCVVRISISFFIFLFSFLFLVGPSSIQIRDNTSDTNANVITLIEGTTRQFICRTSSSNPQPIVVWKLDGQIISGDIAPIEEEGEDAGTIIKLVKTIGLHKKLRDYHDRILSCEARNPVTRHTVVDSVRLNVIC